MEVKYVKQIFKYKCKKGFRKTSKETDRLIIKVLNWNRSRDLILLSICTETLSTHISPSK
jgi:hypothetical protein